MENMQNPKHSKHQQMITQTIKTTLRFQENSKITKRTSGANQKPDWNYKPQQSIWKWKQLGESAQI